MNTCHLKSSRRHWSSNGKKVDTGLGPSGKQYLKNLKVLKGEVVKKVKVKVNLSH